MRNSLAARAGTTTLVWVKSPWKERKKIPRSVQPDGGGNRPVTGDDQGTCNYSDLPQPINQISKNIL